MNIFYVGRVANFFKKNNFHETKRIFSALAMISVVSWCLYKGEWWLQTLFLGILTVLWGEWGWIFFSSTQAKNTPPNKNLLQRFFVFLLGGVYIFFAFSFLWHLFFRNLHVYNMPCRALGVFCYFLVVSCGADICAYYGGRYFKGPLLVPSISPRKTWSGFVAGFLGGGFLGSFFFFPSPIGTIGGGFATYFFSLWISCGVACIAQGGDLLESMAKRYFCIKDSSALVPGHGGFLDVLDGFLALCFVGYMFVRFFS